MDFLKKVKRYVLGEVCTPQCSAWDLTQQSAGNAHTGTLPWHIAWLKELKAAEHAPSFPLCLLSAWL